MFTRLILSLLFLSFLLPQSLFAGNVTKRIQSTQTLVVGTPGDFPPFTVINTQGKLIGLDIDLVTNLARGLGVELKLKKMEFAKLLPAVKDGSIDIAVAGITMLPERNLDVAFIGPYAFSGQTILAKKEIIDTLTSDEALSEASFSVAVVRGTTSEKAVREGMQKSPLTLTDTHDVSLMLLHLGKVDAILADLPLCKLSALRYPDKDLVMLEQPLTFEPLGIALSGDDPLFMNIVQNYLLLMEGSGTLKQMQERWFKHDDWIKELPDMNFFMNMER